MGAGNTTGQQGERSTFTWLGMSVGSGLDMLQECQLEVRTASQEFLGGD